MRYPEYESALDKAEKECRVLRDELASMTANKNAWKEKCEHAWRRGDKLEAECEKLRAECQVRENALYKIREQYPDHKASRIAGKGLALGAHPEMRDLREANERLRAGLVAVKWLAQHDSHLEQTIERVVKLRNDIVTTATAALESEGGPDAKR